MTMRQDQEAGREILITRVFNAPREVVWRAWTEPDQVAKWFGPRGSKVTVVAKCT